MKYFTRILMFMLAVTFLLCLFTACSDDDDDNIDNSSNVSSASGTINGHEYVDLGLSVKWATCNVGASSPSDYGDYYAWGEINTKSNYSAENSVTYGKSMESIEGDATYDVARANWGGTWRLPTASEIDELVNECTYEWTTRGGHNGYMVTGPNGNSIYFPAAGEFTNTSILLVGELCYCWSATPYEDNMFGACLLQFEVGSFNWVFCRMLSGARFCGRSVRPVSE